MSYILAQAVDTTAADNAVSGALTTLVDKVLSVFAANLPTVIAVAGVFVGLSVVVSLFYRFARS